MYEISRYLPYFQKTRTVVQTNPTVLVQLCAPNPDRAVLFISITANQLYWLWTVPGGDTLAADISGTGPDTPMVWWQRHGPLATEAWYGMINGASGTVKFVVTEYTFKPPSDETD